MKNILMRFKKVILCIVLGIVIVIVSIVGVIKVNALDMENYSKVEVKHNKENAVKKVAKKLYTDIVEGNKNNIYENCSEKLKVALTDDIIDEIYKKYSSYKFKDFYDIQYNYLKENDSHYVLVIGEFEEDYIQLECLINNENKVEEIQNIISYGNLDKNIKPIETDIFKEEIVKVGKYELTGILTLPKNMEKVPVVLIVSGSGPQSANGKIYGLKPYQDIAYGLAKYGIATLRVNDRYYEKPNIWTLNDTVYDEYIDDASSAIQLLSNYEGIDANNMFVIGHSQGGSVLPKIAENNPKIKGLISMAGAPRSLIYGICEQYEVLESINAKTDEEKEAIKEKYNKLLEEVLKDRHKDKDLEKIFLEMTAYE